jgi:hypothetical protein
MSPIMVRIMGMKVIFGTVGWLFLLVRSHCSEERGSSLLTVDGVQLKFQN